MGICEDCDAVQASGKKYVKCPYCGHLRFDTKSDLCSCVTFARRGAHNKRERVMTVKNEEAGNVLAE